MEIVKTTEKYIQWMRVRGLSPKTIENYSAQLKLFLNYFSHKARGIEVSSDEIIEYLLTKIKPNTQRHAHSAIKLFYTNIVGQPLKFKHIPYTQKEKKLPIPLERNEIIAMIQACDNKKHLAIIYLLYGCGLRVSEVINLKWKHIERNAGVIHIIQAKGKKDRRVTLFDELTQILTEYYREYQEQCKGKEFVFVGQFCQKYSERSIQNILKMLANKAGIKRNVHPHLLRHSYASHLLENGTDLKLIQELLGHSNTKTTEIYLHISKAHIRKIKSPLQEALAN